MGFNVAAFKATDTPTHLIREHGGEISNWKTLYSFYLDKEK
jgi:hypothetical protein